MDVIHILCCSPNKAFTKGLQKHLTSSQGQPGLPFKITPSSDLPADLDKKYQIVIIDLESFDFNLDQFLIGFEERSQKQSLVLIAEKISPIPLPTEHNIYKISQSDLGSSLFLTFLYSLVSQSKLLESNLAVQEDLNYRLNELLSIRKASLHLTMNLSLDSVLEAILESALDLVSADDTHVFFYEHGVLSFASALFNGHQQNEPYLHPRPNGLTYLVAKEGKKKVINNMLTDPLFKDQRWEGSIIGLPLKIGNRVLGVMNVAIKRAHIFTENEIRTLEFLGEQASIAIQNAKLYEQAQHEIADRKKAEKAIKHLANHDALTGLPNRRLFYERILIDISRAQRYKQKIAVMLFDLDHLKKVNDSRGHNVGDLLLQAVAQRLLGLLRKSDTVARMGGDEFLVILPEVKDHKDSIRTAERILATISTPYLLEGYEVNITTSIGISIFPDDGGDAKTLIKKADIAMYKAKERGGNIYHLYTV
jgi:diguanylate cyclase (GGDEF)-like protein